MLRRIANLLILRPSRRPIEVAGKQQVKLQSPYGSLEVWSEQQGAGPPEIVVLKFPGTSGRAERATLHPADCWSDHSAEMIAVNPHGYGGSSGGAAIHALAAGAEAAYQHALERANGAPVVLAGNSLGTVSALYLAARFPVAGVVLRNGPPLRQLIVGRFGWWNFNVAARLIARQVPPELDSVENASACTAPAVFLSSGQDQVVPPPYQHAVIDAYSGPKRVATFASANHTEIGEKAEVEEYLDALQWLKTHFIETPKPSDSNAGSP